MATDTGGDVDFLRMVLAGVIGAVATLSVTWLASYLRRPKLALSFAAAERGCIVDTPCERQPDGAKGTQRALRLRVKNEGWTVAHDVNIAATELVFQPEAKPTNITPDEVLEFRLALSDRTVFDLPSGAYRWLDVVFVDDFGAKDVQIRLAFDPLPARLTLLGFGQAGIYSALALATAEDASPTSLRIAWTWDGTLSGLQIR